MSGKIMTHADLMTLLAQRLANCAPVTLTLASDHAVITQCPPRVLSSLMQWHGPETVFVSVGEGGVRVRLVSVKGE